MMLGGDNYYRSRTTSHIDYRRYGYEYSSPYQTLSKRLSRENKSSATTQNWPTLQFNTNKSNED